VIYLLTALLVIALVVAYLCEALARWARRRTALERFSDSPPPDLRTRRLAELVGVVKTERGRSAIDVNLRQRGSKVWVGRAQACDWKEETRTVDARPFTLVLDDGTRVAVRPGTRTHLSALADLTLTSDDDRVLTASLHDGERARVRGVIVPQAEGESGYREVTGGHVLEAPEGEPLRVEAESAVLQEDLAAAASRRRVSTLLVPAASVCAAVALWHTWALSQSVTVTASVVSVMTCASTYKGKTSYRPCFTASSSDPKATFERIDGEARVGDRILISMVRGDPSYFTEGDTLNPGRRSVAFMAAIGFVVLLLGAGRFIGLADKRRWFDVEPFDSREPA
jgi:hypothetical protein